MTKQERIAIARIYSDLIKADLIIDSGEMEYYELVKSKYSISRLEESEASSMTLGESINLLASLPLDTRCSLLTDFGAMTVSDGFCARSEALILLALNRCLSLSDNSGVSVITAQDSELFSDSGQILYIESEYDEEINQQIKDYHRYIQAEMKLCGFNFVYIPTIISNYKKTSSKLLSQVFSFLMPSFSKESIENLIDKILNLRSQDFLVSLLCDKLGIKELLQTPPAILLNIGQTFVNDKRCSNLLKIEIGNHNLLSFLQEILDYFMNIQKSDLPLSIPVENSKHKFLYYGFYKQLVDLYSLKRSIRCPILINTYQESISFPDLNKSLGGLHRKEKALYTLFLFESAEGGINFNPPKSAKLFNAYQNRMRKTQLKYAKIYEYFGGDGNKAPLLEVPEIRRPMLSRIKKSLSCFEEDLHDLSNYLIHRDSNGVYNVNLDRELLLLENMQKGHNNIYESDLYNKLELL